MWVALHIIKVLRDKRAHESKGDPEQRLSEYYGPPRASRFSHMFPSDKGTEPNTNLPRPPTVYLPDGVGPTMKTARHNPTLEQPADQLMNEPIQPPTELSTPEHRRQGDGLEVSTRPSTTLELIQRKKKPSRTDSACQSAPKRAKFGNANSSTAQQPQYTPLTDYISKSLNTGTSIDSDPSGQQAQRARPD